MGMFSGITNAISGAAKGVLNLHKSIIQANVKVFKSVIGEGKRFLATPLGKAVLIGATIYFGGAALGYWNSGFSSIDGALAATQAASAAAPAAAAAGEAGAGAAATDAAAGAATGGLAGGTAVGPAAAAPATGLGGTMAAAPVASAAGTPFAAPAIAAAPAVAPAAAPGFMSTFGGAVSGAAKWMAANPIPTLVGGQMLSNALSPNQLDVNAQQNQFRIDEENRRLALIDQANQRIAGVGAVPTWQYSGAKVPTPGPVGIMNRSPA